ncbi:MAG: 2Fe-2S iron-sulfur cluster-binding protein [Pirellulales bacterium]
MSSPDPIQFSFDGRTIPAAPGQSVGGALHTADQHLLSRSFKYHRPRGLFCVSGRCPNCLCTVDGQPNVRICTLQPAPGMKIVSQNRWPWLGLDVMSIFDKFSRFMPVGFYYKQFFKPRWTWPLWEKFIRRVAGLGQIDLARGAEGEYDKLNLFCDVAVVGGGLAGLNAALAAADNGASVILFDEQPALGGHLRHDPDLSREAGLAQLIDRVQIHAGIQVFPVATVTGLFEENYLAALQGQRLIRTRARQIIVAAGGWERPLVFANNDLPGILLASGVQRLLHLDGCKFEGQSLIVTDNAQGYRVARQLAAAGNSVAGVVDLRPIPPQAETNLVHDAHIPVYAGQTIVAARGGSNVEGAVLSRRNGEAEHNLACRWIVQAVGFTPASSLLYQSGATFRHNAELGHAVVNRLAANVHAAGAVVGTHCPAMTAWQGRRAGLAAASALQPQAASLAERLRQCDEEKPQPAVHSASASDDHDAHPPADHSHEEHGHDTHAHEPELPPDPITGYVSPGGAKKKFVCLCEDVTEKDVYDAIDEGYANIETLKRYSTISMGPCQGKMCQAAAVALCAHHNGRTIDETGVPTSRPPEIPLPLGALAGKSLHFSIVRRTPLHGWHERHGARFMDAGTWKRPERNTSPEQEYHAVRTAAGLVDVSTLGKLELRGRDVVPFLEYLYPNRFADLKVGRTRYGVVCDGGGIILDDGTVSRLADDRYFLTTTTGNADAMESWFRFNLAARPDWDVTLANVSAGYAAMNLAGPHSRQILSQLTAGDVSASGLPYLAVGQFEVAGVPAIVFRIGFVGELGYEIHVPAQHGLHVWERLIAAGQPQGLVPFGVEAQRRLRLDKKHILAGIDTDALSNPLEADLAWIVKLDKPDFVGKRTLARLAERGPQNRLVGFRMTDDAAPAEAALILHEGRLAGRVTSSRFSSAAGAYIGLAWVPVDLGHDGGQITIYVDGEPHTATVQEKAFYDPEGAKLRG